MPECRRGRGAAAALLVLPLLFLAGELVLRTHGLPYWLWFNLDPSYVYLLNGMHVLEGVAPGHVDHPGTPVQSLMALVLWLSAAGSASGVADAAFANAEVLLERTSTVILSLDAAGLLLLGGVVWRRTGQLLPALLAQTAPFLTMLAFKHGYGVKPEPLLLLAVLLLSAALVEQALRPSRAALVALAAMVGFGVACKITFAPIGLAPFAMLRGWRQRVAFVAIAGLALAVFLIPAHGALAHLAEWIVGLATHSGTYGGGGSGLVDTQRYPAAFVKLFFSRPVFLVAYVAAGTLLGMRLRERRRMGLGASGPERALLGVLLAQLAQILMAAKHPSAHYILPALELTGVTLALAWLVARDIEALAPRRRLIERVFASLLALLAVLQSAAFVRQDRELSHLRGAALAVDLARDLPACAHVYSDMASAPSQAWFYNHIYGSNRYGDRLKTALPANDYYFVSWRGRLESWDGAVPAAEIARRSPCIAVRGVDVPTLRGIAAQFGDRFDKAATCTAGAETILVAGAGCPSPR